MWRVALDFFVPSPIFSPGIRISIDAFSPRLKLFPIDAEKISEELSRGMTFSSIEIPLDDLKEKKDETIPGRVVDFFGLCPPYLYF